MRLKKGQMRTRRVQYQTAEAMRTMIMMKMRKEKTVRTLMVKVKEMKLKVQKQQWITTPMKLQ